VVVPWQLIQNDPEDLGISVCSEIFFLYPGWRRLLVGMGRERVVEGWFRELIGERALPRR